MCLRTCHLCPPNGIKSLEDQESAWTKLNLCIKSGDISFIHRLKCSNVSGTAWEGINTCRLNWELAMIQHDSGASSKSAVNRSLPWRFKTFGIRLRVKLARSSSLIYKFTSSLHGLWTWWCSLDSYLNVNKITEKYFYFNQRASDRRISHRKPQIVPRDNRNLQRTWISSIFLKAPSRRTFNWNL